MEIHSRYTALGTRGGLGVRGNRAAGKDVPRNDGGERHLAADDGGHDEGPLWNGSRSAATTLTQNSTRLCIRGSSTHQRPDLTADALVAPLASLITVIAVVRLLHRIAPRVWREPDSAEDKAGASRRAF